MTSPQDLTTVDTLEVPGARLHYEVRGSGPVLLMIPGGPMDGAGFAAIAPLLADRYTVVTYDPRGISRSPLDGPPEDVQVEVQADDAHRLLTAMGTAPAYVLGSSGGAITGLALVTQHPEQVHTLVAHEPPLTELLPDSAQHRTWGEELYETYRNDGAGAAMAKFLAGAGMDAPPAPSDAGPQEAPSPEMLAAMARMQGNLALFFGHMFRPITGFRPDVAALRAAATRIVVGGGTTSKGQVAQRAAVALAEVLGTKLVDFPGDHGGFAGHPDTFAETLHQVLTDAR
jgi:pimeloyl-ACP methyl ester carboxylesterase